LEGSHLSSVKPRTYMMQANKRVDRTRATVAAREERSDAWATRDARRDLSRYYHAECVCLPNIRPIFLFCGPLFRHVCHRLVVLHEITEEPTEDLDSLRSLRRRRLGDGERGCFSKFTNSSSSNAISSSSSFPRILYGGQKPWPSSMNSRMNATAAQRP